ncbi:E3 ubiquitin-protein ligase ATL6-like [Phragmites australis]|uniref:E3 ubiquitin-protein ligase ATL6-like n=1 Tax=Phragmites australis TaxID=29695 RepID=UPI002D773C9E|nr:E3 ubiquitin-protein ligase ATL6-like [Phragmites australis]
MATTNTGRRHPLVVLSLHLAVVGAFSMVTAQAPPPPQLQFLTTTAGRTVPTTFITIAIIAFFVLVFFCVLFNKWSSSSADADASAGARQGSIRRRRRGLDPAAVAALPIVPYAEIRKHKSGGGGLECAVCLTAFDDGDELRLLPQCSHAFHPDCIDPWLEGHVTCPLCRANLENPAPPVVPLSSPETKPETSEAVAVRVDVENDEEERREEAVELEKLRCVRRAARMPRSRSTGHSMPTTAAAEMGEHERFTVRLPPHVREEVLKSRRLRHATSLVVSLGGASNCEGSSTCAGGGGRCHVARRRWPSFLARTTSWAQGGGEESARRGGVGPEAVARRPPCGHVVCSTARWPAQCKAGNLA